MSAKKQASNGKIAAAYIRVSTEDQLEYSPDSQLKIIQEYAKKNGYILPPDFIFVDEGISGRSTKNRSAFMQVIALAKSADHPIDSILLWKFSRFARNQEEAILYKNRLLKNHVSVISISEPLPEGPFGSLIERIIEWEDEYYSINLSQEVRRGMTEKAQRGQLQSTPSFGYRVEDHKLVPVEEEAALVREIFRRFIAGEGYYPIAKWMNSIGARTHRGNRFEHRSIEYIIRNPVYIGKLRWTPTGRCRRNFNHPDTLVVDSDHEPLIDRQTWNAAQERVRQVKELWRYHGRPTYARKHWLSGIVRCATCNNTLIFSAPHYFKCNYYVKGSCLTSQHIHTHILEEAFIAKLQQDMLCADSVAYRLIRSSDGTATDIQLIKRQLEQLERKKVRLREAFLAGADSVEEYKETKAYLDKEIVAAAQELERLQLSNCEDAAPHLLKDHIREALAVLTSPSAAIPQKFDAANAIIENCTWDKAAATLSLSYRVVL